ncbi:tryptophan 7-halogenase [Blastopirellula sp. JC732]|uniref:Tryptophan 7-halogenase n=1 Tax=Blastopirellula sediminis TaxID=2894196 RepID=A0A9X1SHN0_9BACT|nr:NAD(P)/FAD-dependent oxidoreductase [Blastopirellula sediminis]MCC9606088.1 tryptophan 7-halogenase [Blastopirellula sediminis]MCC9630613.1 tryptophan 7-halogenase [Blastopirellula sediminis]
MIANEKPHVVVIGGGPAGSTVSTLIAQKGYRVELFEREVFPRYHIGESLIPETYWVLKRLNMLDKMKDSHFIKKYSVQFVGQSGRLSAPFYFHDNKPHECSQTWQVRRSEFDLMMINNAAEHGVTVHQGARVLDVLFDGDRAIGVKVVDASGETREVFADVVVDASGQSSMLINKFKLRVPDPELNKGAIWTYFKGAYRDVGKDEGATVVLSVQGKNGWFWYIPLHDDIVSVGVVGDFDYLFKGRESHEQTYAEELDRCPAVKERIANAEQVEKIFATKDYTYKASEGAGDGWVLVGDAFGFLDPLYSSGVLLALKSGQLAADAICDALEKGDTSKEQLGNWLPDYLVGMGRMRRLVSEYYEGFNFGRFIRRFPHFVGRVTDLLIGDLFKDDLDEVIAAMDLVKAEDEEAKLMAAKEQD